MLVLSTYNFDSPLMHLFVSLRIGRSFETLKFKFQIIDIDFNSVKCNLLCVNVLCFSKCATLHYLSKMRIELLSLQLCCKVTIKYHLQISIGKHIFYNLTYIILDEIRIEHYRLEQWTELRWTCLTDHMELIQPL